MRRMKLLVFFAAILAAVLLFSPPAKAQSTDDETAGPRGSVPRSSAERYGAHAQQDGVSVGADLLTPKQIYKVFVSDLNRCCLVVEFAFYPNKETSNEKSLHDVSLDDFALYVTGSDVALKPESPTVVAARLQKKADSPSPAAVHGSTGVGYESGTYIDPVTGQPTRVHGVTTATDVSVGQPIPTPAPGSTARDREIMEKELDQKGLPQGKTAAPVAGYLYFSITNRKKNAKYQLEYALNGERLVLQLP
jgi:hypothetical protein